jgi:FAD/FMN-containing dehydrogenase
VSDLTRREVVRAGASAALGLYLPGGLAGRAAALPRVAARARARSHHRRALEELARRLRGRLLLPGQPGYAAATQPANTRFDRIRPLAAAVCADEPDVATCIAWSCEHDIPAVARTGGHSYAGYSTTDGLVIDLGNLKRVTVNPRTGRATIGGGAINQDVFAATVGGDYVLPGGTCLGVGVSGLTLGGGIGYNTHWAGLTCDHLRSTRLVTAAGELLHVDDSHHSDLLWACRGGAGGNFGINTSLTFDLARIPPETSPPGTVSFYRFDYRGADAAEAVLSKFHEILHGAPTTLNAVAMAQAVEVGRGGPREAIASFSRGQFLGPMSKLTELVSPLLEVATPVKTTLQTLSFWEMQAMLAGAEAELHSFGDISRYSAAPLPAGAVAKVVDLLVECPSRDTNNNGSVWSLGWVGGEVMNSVPRSATAYVHRDALTLLRATPVWETYGPPSVERDLVAWSEEVIKAIARYTLPESYQNFPNRGIKDWEGEYYAENFERLVDVKTKYDPDDVFRNAQSIPTRR